MPINLKARPNDYWVKRFERLAAASYAKADKTLPELRKLFSQADDVIKKEIGSFYSKYGVVQSAPVFETLPNGTPVITSTANKVVVPPSVANKKLARGTRLTQLQSQIDAILKDLAKGTNEYMNIELGKLASNAYYDNMYEVYRGYGVGSSFNVISKNTIKSLIHSEVNGADFSSRIWNNTSTLATQVNQTLKTGISQGLTNREMVKRIQTHTGSSYKNAERLMRTEITNAYGQAAKAGWEETGLVKQYEFIATLDDRTSSICTELDGQVFDLDKAVVGLNYPPMHPRCRSTEAAHFDNSARELTRIARDLETGRTFTVPGKMTAQDFKDIYVNKTITRKEWDAKNGF